MITYNVQRWLADARSHRDAYPSDAWSSRLSLPSDESSERRIFPLATSNPPCRSPPEQLVNRRHANAATQKLGNWTATLRTDKLLRVTFRYKPILPPGDPSTCSGETMPRGLERSEGRWQVLKSHDLYRETKGRLNCMRAPRGVRGWWTKHSNREVDSVTRTEEAREIRRLAERARARGRAEGTAGSWRVYAADRRCG